MKIILPKLSATMEEGTIVKWLKQVGEDISEGEALYEVETDKTTMEVESSVSGKLLQVMVPAGKTVATGTEICEITRDSKASAEKTMPSSSPVQAQSDAQTSKPEPARKPEHTSKPVPLASERSVIASAPSSETKRLRISPSAQRLAKAWDVEVDHIQGSGPQGRIRNRDIEARLAQIHSESSRQIKSNRPAFGSSPASPLATGSPGLPTSGVVTSKKLSKMRVTLAREMLRSTQTIPAFWVEKWVNAELLLNWKTLLKQTQGSAFSEITITDFILHAVGIALAETPAVNQRWVVNAQGEADILPVSGSHVGLAVSVDNGILTPILANVGGLLLSELIQMRKEAVEATRSLKPYGIQEAPAITISNLGHTGIDRFQAIIKPDETMILSVGAISEKVASVQGQFVTQQGFTLGLTADHRVLDGIDAAKFLGKIAEVLETGAWKIA